MESWSVGFEGDADVERHTGIEVSAATRPSIRLRIVSDYICPWCYIGLTRVEKLRDEFDIELEVGAFESQGRNSAPQASPREEVSRGRVYPPGYLENLRATATDAGIEMKRPALVPNTRKAHETTEFAKERGLLWEIHRALFHAYFEEERNIGDVDVLCVMSPPGSAWTPPNWERGGASHERDVMQRRWRSSWPGHARPASRACRRLSSVESSPSSGRRTTRSSGTWRVEWLRAVCPCSAGVGANAWRRRGATPW